MTQKVDASSVDDGVVDPEKILVEEVGQCGKYQIRVLALCSLIAVLQGFTVHDYVFTFAKVNTRCLIPECENTSSPHHNFTQPWMINALPPSHKSFDNCHRYGMKTSNSTDHCSLDIFDQGSIKECEEYVYEDKNSAFYEFNMACDDWRPHFLGSISILGMMISLPLTGFVSDRWGRRIAISISAFNSTLFGCLEYFSSSYMSYLLIVLAKGVTGACAFSTSYILALEYVGPGYRVAAGAIITTFFALGSVAQGLVGWTRPHWRNILLIFHAPMFITISYFWIMPESFRWLMSKGRFEEAKEIMKNVARTNGKVLSEKTLQSFSERNSIETRKDGSEPTVVSLVFQHKKVFFRCMLTPLWWITALFIYYGLTLSSVGISGNRYLNYSAVAAIELPGYLATVLLLNRIGRKTLLIAGYWICGACQIAYILMPEGHYWLSLSVYLIGKLTISTVMTTMYVYTAELYPTRYRTTLLGYSSMVGRLGAIIGPLTPALSNAVWQPLPFVLFAGMAFLSGGLVTLAPETLGCALPSSMQDAEKLGEDQKNMMLQCLRRLVSRRKCYTIR